MEPIARRRRSHEGLHPSWHGTAFLIEAILLLAFLIGAIALFMQLFSASIVRSSENDELASAIALASNSAERFAADPIGAGAETLTEDGLTVTCEVTPEKKEGGTLYKAEISVSDGSTEVYRLSTARYVSEVAK